LNCREDGLDVDVAGRTDRSELIRVSGLVQGVGFRPAVWRLTRQHGLRGWVGNDAAGVCIAVRGPAAAISRFVEALRRDPPPLARIDRIERKPATEAPDYEGFQIRESSGGTVHTGVVPDAATCPACRAEIFDPGARRYRYPFTNCTQCGPRLTIIQAIPYDRAATTMRPFRICAACMAEYTDPSDRRFHAQPIACPDCGPAVWLHPATSEDPIVAARGLLRAGRIVAIKSLGGFHLACDATNAEAVARLRQTKRRDAKPFALMAGDLNTIRRFARLCDAESDALQIPTAPIVLLDAISPDALPGVAPGLTTLGFMLPSTPLHHLLLQELDRPLVMTSGNLSDEPQCITNDEALQRLAGIAEHFLLHDREIARRVDDGVVRVIAGATRTLRRARGEAPVPLPLPDGLVDAPPLLAMGGELKNTFCLARDGAAVLSHHMGDLENAATFQDYRRSITEYGALFEHVPRAIVVDRHPEYLSTKLGAELAASEGLPLIEVQHHHAHLAACLAENGVAVDAAPVLGIALDGLGWGDDGTIWGGEFLLVDYRQYRRLACFRPVAMPGGAQAIHEPWRNTLAHLLAVTEWQDFLAEYGGTELARYLAAKPVPLLAGMIARRVNAPLASSCGRLFDAVAAAVGLCSDRAHYEGQAAILLEAAANNVTVPDAAAYHFTSTEGANDVLHLDPTPMWLALLRDLMAGTSTSVVAARFHTGLAIGLAQMVERLGISGPVALSGGVFQNRLLLESLIDRIAAGGRAVLTHRVVPANDGGLALGQAAIAAARMLCGDEGA
jgi:hydrogenase maturation protein HypF